MPEDIAKSYRFLRFLGMSARGAYLIQQRFFSSFIFVHINKCGGTSIQRALGIPVKGHDTALERKRKIGRRWDSLYKFSVIRHSYYRVESLDRYRVKTNQNAMQDERISLDDWILRDARILHFSVGMIRFGRCKIGGGCDG